MLKRLVWLLLVASGGMALAATDTIELKEKATLTGKILAETRREVVIDIGYTSLVVPRKEIAHIKKAIGAEAPDGQPALAVAAPPAAASPAQVAPPRMPAPSPGAIAESKGEGAASANSLFASATGALAERSVRELVSQLGESVVQVRTPGGLGSGFFINDEGFLITNFHVIEGETQISIEVYQQRAGQLERKNYKQVRIVAINKFDDLALLKVEDGGAPKFGRVLLGSSDTMAVGERVFAIGSPMGLERTVTEGIISTKTRQFQGELYLQTTAQINPGNSGGPLFNLRGEVIGVTNMKISFGEGLGFAIPVEGVRYFLNHRDAFAYDNDNPSNAYRYLEPPKRLKKAEERATP